LRRLFYRALFHSAHETLLAVCANPDNLGGRAGGMSILHTWEYSEPFCQGVFFKKLSGLLSVMFLGSRT